MDHSFHLKVDTLKIILFLFFFTIVVYSPAVFNGFVDYDDGMYITRNDHVQAGMNWNSVLWAFKNTESGIWHPLTWISHLLDYQIFGLKPAGHHFTNIIFHALNTALLFALFYKMTGALFPCTLNAFIFGIHPLHVESVAWVSERKDVLSLFFFFLSLGAYLGYLRERKLKWYGALTVSFCFGLMAKPSLVTFPFILLLLDFWPLNRLSGHKIFEKNTWVPLILEKLPLFILSIGASLLAVWAQKSQLALGSFHTWPLAGRISNAFISYASYVLKALFPINLTFLYPHLGNSISLLKVTGAVLFFVGFTWLCCKSYSQRPYLITGWLWYLGTLIPMIGLVQVGQQAMADRYSYIPLIGLSLISAFFVHELFMKFPYGKRVFIILGCFLAGLISTRTIQQIATWKNSEVLYQHALNVSEKNHVVRINLGNIHVRQKSWNEAIHHFSRVLQDNPKYAGVHLNLGNIYFEINNFERAKYHFLEASKYHPEYEEALNNLGNIYAHKNDLKIAEVYYRSAILANPKFTESIKNLGTVLVRLGRVKEGKKQFKKALTYRPDFAEAHFALGMVYAVEEAFDEAILEFNQAIPQMNDDPDLHYNLGVALIFKGKLKRAVEHFESALSFDPDHQLSMNQLKRLGQ